MRDHERTAEDPFKPPPLSPPAPAPVHPLLALQRAAGNHAVAATLSGRRVQRGAGALTALPEIDFWHVHVRPGPQGRGRTRTLHATPRKVYVGDTVVVRARFKALRRHDHDFVGSELSAGGEADIKRSWENARTLKWELRYKKVGLQTARLRVHSQGMSASDEEHFLVVADLQDFTLACVEAQSTLLGKFNAAARRINEAAGAFRKAYAEQEADLKDVAQQEKMIEDLIWGAVFAGAGGVAGGFVGGWMKTMKDGAFKNRDYVVDAAKDTVKFALRSGDKLRGGGSPTTKGDSTAPSLTDPGRTQGERKASGEDPLDFLTDLAAKVAGDGEKAQAALTTLIHDAREARSADSKADFSEDPVAVATRDLTLDSITAQLNTDKNLYLKSLWKTWLGAYAYKARGDDVKGNVGRKIRKKLEKAASACGESADAWIAEFGLPAKQRAEAEAAAYEPPPAPAYGP